MWSPYDYIAAISERAGESFLGVFPELAEKVIPLSNMMPDAYIRQMAREPLNASEMLADGAVRLLSIGRFCRAKNFDNVPDICRRLIGAGLNIKWYLIGYGGDEGLIREKIIETGMEDRVMEFPVSSATVQLASQALGCEPGRIAKTLSFLVKGKPILILMAGDEKIDNRKFKAQFGAKAKMPAADETESLIGHAGGGVCPFAVNEGIDIFLDESLKRFETVFPACGSSNSAIELTIKELETYSGYVSWVDVRKEQSDESSGRF